MLHAWCYPGCVPHMHARWQECLISFQHSFVQSCDQICDNFRSQACIYTHSRRDDWVEIRLTLAPMKEFTDCGDGCIYLSRRDWFHMHGIMNQNKLQFDSAYLFAGTLDFVLLCFEESDFFLFITFVPNLQNPSKACLILLVIPRLPQYYMIICVIN